MSHLKQRSIWFSVWGKQRINGSILGASLLFCRWCHFVPVIVPGPSGLHWHGSSWMVRGCLVRGGCLSQHQMKSSSSVFGLWSNLHQIYDFSYDSSWKRGRLVQSSSSAVWSGWFVNNGRLCEPPEESWHTTKNLDGWMDGGLDGWMSERLLLRSNVKMEKRSVYKTDSCTISLRSFSKGSPRSEVPSLHFFVSRTEISFL